MKKVIKHNKIKKGKKKFKLRFLKCFIGIHNYEYNESSGFDLLDKDQNIVGETELHLYICKTCKKEKLIATPIILNKNK